MVREILQFGSKRDIVPRNPFADHISGHALVVERHLHCAGWVINPGHTKVEVFIIECLERLVAECIISDGANCHRIITELGNMVSKIGGCTTEFFTFG